MGVPGFFIWLVKKYKGDKFSEKQSFGKQFIKTDIDVTKDWLMFDTNCLLHPMCFKVLAEFNSKSKKSVKFDDLEKKMIKKCLEYIEEIIDFVNPKNVFIAIDGVAPSAKMKQQRYRRYKSIYDKKLRDKLRKKYKKEDEIFWNNSAISPGTKFMKKLHVSIEKWVKKNTKNFDELIYSSCYERGEGEHKILQYIRDCEKTNNYIIYGLDADLIFLALASGKNNIYLLRENVHLKIDTDSLSYIDMDVLKNALFKTITNNLDVELELNNVINDFIFICYFLGNDFLPHLESYSIHHKGLDSIIKKYVRLHKENYGYLYSDQMINQMSLAKFVEYLAEDEHKILQLKYGSEKRKRYCESKDPYDKELFKIENLQFEIKDEVLLGNGEFKDYRKRYYSHYYHIKSDHEYDEFSDRIVYEYLKGLKWVTKYYFEGCCSWSWHYLFDNPPFVYDILRNIKEININKIFIKDDGNCCPEEQLLCVIPPQAVYLLPKEIRFLMSDDRSPLIHMYPYEFELDYLNKGMYWNCNPILPQIDLGLIKKTFKKYGSKLTSN